MKKAMLAWSAALAVSAFGVSARAADTYTDLSAWQAAVGSYTETTQYAAENDTVNSIALSSSTSVTFDHTLEATSIGDAWGTWSGGYTGQVLVDPAYTAESLTMAVGGSTHGFGFFIEPDLFDAYTFTLLLSDGSTEVATYNGDSGAGFLGFVGDGVTSVTVSTSGTDFAVGDFFASTSAAPEPSTWAMMLAGVGLAGLTLRSRKRTLAHAA